MEVHTQFGEIRTIKDFLVRLLLIVLGVVIAVMVTQYREQSQRETLAGHMKVRLGVEVSDNAKAVAAALTRYESAKKQLGTAVNICKQRRDGVLSTAKVVEQLGALNIDLRTPSLVSTQWKLANANQSIRDFSIDEATRFAGAYSLQDSIESVLLQHKASVTSAFADTNAMLTDASVEELQRACRALTYLSLYSAAAANNLLLLSTAYGKLNSETAAGQ